MHARRLQSLHPQTETRKGNLFSKRKSMKFDNLGAAQRGSQGRWGRLQDRSQEDLKERLQVQGYTVHLDCEVYNEDGHPLTRLIHTTNPVGSTVYVRDTSTSDSSVKFTQEECILDMSMCSDSLELSMPEIKGVVISYKDISCLVTKDVASGKMDVVQYRRTLPLGDDTMTVSPVLDADDIASNAIAALSNVDVVYSRLVNLTVDRCMDIMDSVDNKYRELTLGLKDLYNSLDTTLYTARTEYDRAREVGKASRSSTLEQCHFEIFTLCRRLETYVSTIDALTQEVEDLRRGTDSVIPSD